MSAAGLALMLVGLVAGLFSLTAQPYWPVFVGILAVVAVIAIAARLSRAFAVVITIVAMIVAGGVTFSQATVSTPPITDAHGNVIPGSIAEMRTINLGGVDQWVMIRGRSATDPILLYLAGGPGGTSFALNREYNSELEDHFVVVNWEQRGAGKSAGALFGDWAGMNPQQYTADGLHLTDYLRHRFHQSKIYLWGQSWGTMLGVWMIQHQPDWFAAWIGVGQMVNPVADDRLIYNDVLERARSSGNSNLVNKLIANGPPPYHGIFGATNYTTIFGPNDDLQRQLVRQSAPLPEKPQVGMTEGPEYGLADQIGAQIGLGLTFAVVYDQLDSIDLIQQAPELKVPVYFIEGKYDLNARPVLVQQWFDSLRAPIKQLIWFDHSGHNPAHDEATRFNDFMVNTLLDQAGRT